MEKWWLLRDDFQSLVTDIWKSVPPQGSAVDTWQAKIRKLRKITKGWSSNEEANIKRYKKILLEEFDKLDVKAETSPLEESEQNRMNFLHPELKKI